MSGREEPHTICLRLHGSLRIYANNVFRSTGSDKGAAPVVTSYQVVDLVLQSLWAYQLTLGVLSLKGVSIFNYDFD